jgi:hypothetical protein
VPERPNGTVLKTVVVNSYRGFKSHRFLQMKPQTYKSGVFSYSEFPVTPSNPSKAHLN